MLEIFRVLFFWERDDKEEEESKSSISDSFVSGGHELEGKILAISKDIYKELAVIAIGMRKQEQLLEKISKKVDISTGNQIKAKVINFASLRQRLTKVRIHQVDEIKDMLSSILK
jgi:hypothetical protein